MKTATNLAALAATFSMALAASQGFNYGSTFTDGTPKQQSDFENEFKTAQCLTRAPGGGFNSARLYTMVQGGTANDPISAIPAAISTNTHLLLGMWASAGDAAFANELQALVNAIATYQQLADLVDGISVGSEDLYRVSPTGIQNMENPGAQPDTIVGYIKQVRNAISGTALAGVPIGHVDTWTAWVNSSNSAVASASDWVGVDAYPYFQNTMPNSIENGKSLFDSAMEQTQAAVGGKPVWVTETGFPVSGKTSNMAVPGLDNAQKYWQTVGCPMFGSTNVWWYTLQDAAPSTPNPSFGIVGSTLSCTPVFDISCNASSSSSSTASSSVSSAKSSSAATTSGSGSGSGSGSSSSTSSAAASGASITSVPTSIGGGSPGAGTGLGSSQVSLETSSITSVSKPTGSTVVSTPTPTSGSGSGNSTISSTSKPTASTVASGAGPVAGSIGAAFVAVVGAIVAL